MANNPDKFKKNLENSFMRRFESNEDLRSQLGQTHDHAGSSGGKDGVSDDTQDRGLPSVEEMHGKLLSGVQKGISMPNLPIPEKKHVPAKGDRKDPLTLE